MKKSKNLPLYEVTPFGSIREMLAIALREASDKLAFRYRAEDVVRDVTYAAFCADIAALGAALAALGLDRTHVANSCENRYEWILLYLTMLESAGVYVPIDKDLPTEDAVNIFNQSDSEVLFCSSHTLPAFLSKKSEMPKLKVMICFDSTEGIQGAEEVLLYSDLMEKGRALVEMGQTNFPGSPRNPEELALLVYTSGTTGMAKGVMLSEKNLCSSVYYGMQVSSVREVYLSVLPYHHTYEAVAGLLVHLHNHSTICINENTRTVLKNLAFYKPQIVYLVPAYLEVFYKKIMAKAAESGKETILKAAVAASGALKLFGADKKFFKEIRETFGGRLEKIVCGGAPLRPELSKFFEAMGFIVVNGYGITECSPLVSANRDEICDPTTVGVILPCCEVTFDDLQPDGSGEICVKGDIVMMGYYKNPEATAEVLTDGVFHTGDYGKMTSKGLLLITGRKKNLIVLENGKNVFPEEIEKYIATVPYVAEVVVFGIKNADGDEVGLAAEVFLNEEKVKELGLKEPEASLKRDIAKACFFLPGYKKVSKIYIRPIPFEQTTTRKIRRSSLINQ